MNQLIREKLQIRADFFGKIRQFFLSRNVIEVDTNLLTDYGVTDVNLVSIKADDGFLITSPEFSMKKLLAFGSGDIYQLGHVFRGEELGKKHLREFTLLEWYRVGFSQLQLIEEVGALVQNLLPDKAGLPVILTNYADLFLDYLQIDIFAISDRDLQNLVSQHLNQTIDLDRDGYLDLLFSYLIEPNLGKDCLQFVCQYPASQAALAKTMLNDKNQLVAQRFELYIDGLELCNGFVELTDADEQRNRFILDNQIRKYKNLPQMPIDESFLSALSKGMPECAGVALGVDRLLMLLCKTDNINQISWSFGLID